MLAGIHSRLTYANVVSTLCLFLLLGGGAYAAFSLPRDSVKSKHIVNGQVKRGDLSPKVATAANINERWDTQGGSPANQPFGTFGTLTITGRCTDQGTEDPELRIELQRADDAELGKAQIAYVQTGGEATDSTSLPVDDAPSTLFVESEDEAEGAGVLVYNDSTQVTTIPFRLFTDGDSIATCEFAGQATTTTKP